MRQEGVLRIQIESIGVHFLHQIVERMVTTFVVRRSRMRRFRSTIMSRLTSTALPRPASPTWWASRNVKYPDPAPMSSIASPDFRSSAVMTLCGFAAKAVQRIEHHGVDKPVDLSEPLVL